MMQQIPADDVVLMGDPRVAEIPIREVDDGLVDVRDVPELAPDPLKETPSGAYALLRRGVFGRLLAAQELLPAGYRLLLVEGYRPYDLQERYFSSYRAQVEELDPGLD
ncbi:MAG: dipeptidase, partial [Nocardioidaceae bacterium]